MKIFPFRNWNASCPHWEVMPRWNHNRFWMNFWIVFQIRFDNCRRFLYFQSYYSLLCVICMTIFSLYSLLCLVVQSFLVQSWLIFQTRSLLSLCSKLNPDLFQTQSWLMFLPEFSETKGTEDIVRLLNTVFDVLNGRCVTESINSFNYPDKLKVT